ncbi:MAG: ABC transporter permease subunit [Phycisphaerae bacterium]|nr:ABC transporter permease subunit [Phycisphaerae bacterium]
MWRRTWIIYRKELIESLRDRRTLIAMLLVPLLLYPVLMIIIIQALQVEKGRRERDVYKIALPNEAHERWLRAILEADTEEEKSRASQTRPAGSIRPDITAQQFRIIVTHRALEDAVRGGDAAVAVQLDPPPGETLDANGENRQAIVYYDPAEYLSEVAFRAFARMLDRHRDRVVLDRLRRVGLTADTLSPLQIVERSVASPQKLGGALLGQILPFLLVVMTATGAIYPAIDLTAGERERGTLETLMVTPVPIAQIVAGKFLVVVTIAILSTLLNLASMGATIRFGGIGQAIAQSAPAAGQIEIPFRVLPIVLVVMVPFAVLFSAVMLAVCSFARTFKEAQNYMTPVIIAAMVPAMLVSYMPSIRLVGAWTVLPVANVVVLLRELFLEHYDVPAMLLAFTATTLYAATAVVIATRLYGQEAVLFSDVGSYKTLLRRRLFRPAPTPSVSTALFLVAVVFPLSFYWQTTFATPAMSAERLRFMTIVLMLACFLAPPIALAWYLKLDPRETFALRPPSSRAMLAAVLIAVAAPILALTLARAQQRLFPPSDEMIRALADQQTLMLELPIGSVLLTFAILPGLCEEVLFRGWLLAGLRNVLHPATRCIIVGLVFGLFHTDLYRILSTSLIGMLLAYVVTASGSLLPAIIIHAGHNGLALLVAKHEPFAHWMGVADDSPAWIVPAAAIVAVIGLALIRSARPPADSAPTA